MPRRCAERKGTVPEQEGWWAQCTEDWGRALGWGRLPGSSCSLGTDRRFCSGRLVARYLALMLDVYWRQREELEQRECHRHQEEKERNRVEDVWCQERFDTHR
ncbi:hypothetical protein WMY93_005599 [Mugilogobius chulae]|uniref:Uncharacterized protein n=1 Tax=Mugilogobius chulae TaxID=88201 RepID=A0AAW0PKD4_9GOBI